MTKPLTKAQLAAARKRRNASTMNEYDLTPPQRRRKASRDRMRASDSGNSHLTLVHNSTSSSLPTSASRDTVSKGIESATNSLDQLFEDINELQRQADLSRDD